MELIIKTDNPTGLLSAIKKEIDDKKIETWSYDKDGDFTHTTSNRQWENKAWLRPVFGKSDELKFTIIKPQNATLTDEIRGVYLGRFIEMIIAHFKTKFTTMTVLN